MEKLKRGESLEPITQASMEKKEAQKDKEEEPGDDIFPETAEGKATEEKATPEEICSQNPPEKQVSSVDRIDENLRPETAVAQVPGREDDNNLSPQLESDKSSESEDSSDATSTDSEISSTGSTDSLTSLTSNSDTPYLVEGDIHQAKDLRIASKKALANVSSLTDDTQSSDTREKTTIMPSPPVLTITSESSNTDNAHQLVSQNTGTEGNGENKDDSSTPSRAPETMSTEIVFRPVTGDKLKTMEGWEMLEMVISWLSKEFSPDEEALARQLANQEISYRFLWLYFTPGSLVSVEDPISKQPMAGRVFFLVFKVNDRLNLQTTSFRMLATAARQDLRSSQNP